MTAEIAIMSRTAVVLAADSATTVTTWKNGELEKRYFKGANKLYELSRRGPVGLMIFGSASLQTVPWELYIKSFRDDLGVEQFDKLQTYSEKFFDFVQHNDKLFSKESKKDALLRLLGGASYRLQNIIAAHVGESDVEHLKSTAPHEIDAALTQAEIDVENLILPDLVTEADIANAVSETAADLEAVAIQSIDIFVQDPDRAHLVPRFVAALIKLAVKQFLEYASLTGVVIAGYGKEEYFPILEVYDCYGFLGDRLIVKKNEDDSKTMDASSPAVIQPFATTHMIDTFRMGVSPDVFGAVYDSSRMALSEMGTRVMNECGAQNPLSQQQLEEIIAETRDSHADQWYEQIRNQHVFPLSNIINSLPLPDMAGLARSLIELESLKERVTRPSESVSGPIDVAVISKHDGFVWIDRKHYFKPELNPRFFKRAE
ncbi:hypothetical protein PUP66_30095 [Pseudomonas chlororaphis]|uniref:hypothetical protein n=1 Tax=Pseudomonas chlororaphis TaxID=587753 RepID=UPI000E0BBC92|nr:hypothetical protein [Pseudomonas chlororaphis]AZD18778.1 hypothetical protein C4K25_5894 [Pseudomonas chlororaphis]WDH47271.1 hypothetical protein PUP66_30095 [Pseudomonas chlororaphis]WDH59118.1 hypothetical protein PUP56_30100 [Pseudomonas chlororaphis]WQE18374.1 hypothetical protein U0007_28910 [Pseudomonas chlororaphis]